MPFGNSSWLFVILLFAGIFLLRWFGLGGGCCGPHTEHGGHGESKKGVESSKSEALEILNRRYASGEIDSEEYRRKKEEILGK